MLNKFFKIFVFIFLFLCLFDFAFALNLTDNFDDYPVGTLDGKGNWTNITSNQVYITSAKSNSISNSIHLNGAPTSNIKYDADETNLETDFMIIEFNAMTETTTAKHSSVCVQMSSTHDLFCITTSGTPLKTLFYYKAWANVEILTPVADNWHNLKFYLDIENYQVKYSVDGAEYSVWYDCMNEGFGDGLMDHIYFYWTSPNTDSYIDDLKINKGETYSPDQNQTWSEYMQIFKIYPNSEWSGFAEENPTVIQNYKNSYYPWTPPIATILPANTIYDGVFRFKPFPNSTMTSERVWWNFFTWNDSPTTIWETDTARIKLYKAKNNWNCGATSTGHIVGFDERVNYGNSQDDSTLTNNFDVIEYGEETFCPYASTTSALFENTYQNWCDTTFLPVDITTEPAGYCREYLVAYEWDTIVAWKKFVFLSPTSSSTIDDLIIQENTEEWIEETDTFFDEDLGFFGNLIFKVVIGDKDVLQATIIKNMDAIYDSLEAKFPSNYIAYILHEVEETIDEQATTTCFESIDMHFWGSGEDEVVESTGEICLNVGIPENKRGNFDIFLQLAMIPIIFGCIYAIFSPHESVPKDDDEDK